MATLREGCEPPVQPAIPADAKKHPMYPEYLRRRAAWAAQLVTGPTFECWLSQMPCPVCEDRACETKGPRCGQ